MNANVLVAIQSVSVSWMVCLFQVTLLLSIAYAVNVWLLRRCPTIASTIGLVAMTASTALVVMTLVNVPRPIELMIDADAPALQSTSMQADAEAMSANAESALSQASIFELMSQFFLQPDAPYESEADALKSSVNSISPWQSVSWLVVLSIAFAVIRFICGYAMLQRLTYNSRQFDVADAVLDSVLLALEPNVHDRQRYSVRTFAGQGSPFVSWLTGKTIFVPETFASWAEDEKFASLAHEVSHLRRRDHIGRLLLEVTRSVLWVHPVASMLFRQTSLAQELAADQMAAISDTNIKYYRRALSRLAIRFDAECRGAPTFCVSISSSLIRRINMLKQMDFYRRPRPAVQRVSLVLAIAMCSALSCWSVAAQTPQDVAGTNSVALASHNQPIKPFSQPTSQPWNSLGNQPGYLSVRFSKIIQHPDVKPLVPGIVTYFDAEMFPGNDLKDDFGMHPKNIKRIEGSLHYNFDPKGNVGSRSSVHLGGSAISIESESEIDWPGLMNAIDLSVLVGEAAGVSVEKLKATVLEGAAKGKNFVFRLSKLFPQKTAEGTPDKMTKRLWDSVAGGDVAIMYNVDLKSVAVKDSAIDQAYLDLMSDSKAVGFGVEFSPDFSTSMLRVIVAPKSGVELKQVKLKAGAFRDAMVAELNGAEDDAEKLYAEQLAALEIKVVELPGESSSVEKGELGLIVAEGRCEVPLSQLFTSSSARQEGVAELKELDSNDE